MMRWVAGLLGVVGLLGLLVSGTGLAAQAQLPPSFATNSSAMLDGAMLYDPVQQTFGVQERGMPNYKSGITYSAGNFLTTSGTTATTLLPPPGLGSLTFSPNFWVPGKIVHLYANGQITTAAAPGTVTIVAGLQFSRIAGNSPAITPAANLTSINTEIDIWMTCYTVASNSARIWGNGKWVVGGTIYPLTSLVPTSVNSTIPLALTLTSTNSISGGTVFTITTAFVEIKG